MSDVDNYAQKAWASQVTEILIRRKEEKVETKCQVGDLVKGKIIFECADHLRKALTVADEICQNRGATILQLENRLFESSQDVVLTLKVKESVC